MKYQQQFSRLNYALAGTTLLSAAVVVLPGAAHAQTGIPAGLEQLSIVKYARSVNNPSGDYGEIREVKREKREPVDTSNLDVSLPKTEPQRPEEYKEERIPEIADLHDESQFEFF